MATQILCLSSGNSYGLPRFPYRILHALATGEALSSLCIASLQFALIVLLYAPFDAAELPLEKRVLKKYEEQFFKVVEVKEIASGLHRREVIPQTVLNRIKKSDSDKEERELLFDHLMQHGDMDSVKAFCEEADLASGYPHMQKLGRDMLDMLGQKG